MKSTIIKADRVRLGQLAGTAVVSAQREATCTGPRTGKKNLQLLEENGRVRAIEFTCSCGEKTVIELEYPLGAEEAQQ